MDRNLRQVWDQLRAQRPQRQIYLEEVRIEGLRNIANLRIPFPYPVSVLAGPNGSGKTTVLFAAACAYSSPTQGERLYTPAAMFPGFRPRSAGGCCDLVPRTALTYAYLADGERQAMQWARGEQKATPADRGGGKWNRRYLGRKGAATPVRTVFLRTLANLSNPSEVRSILQMARAFVNEEPVDAAQLAFAHRILRYRYQRLTVLRSGSNTRKQLLFAERTREADAAAPAARYSEFHMSAGERAVVRLSMDLSALRDALVLIDEVEAGLHPYTQQQLMLELQRLALRNGLQIIVTTHSPVVLESVPPEGRLFLDVCDDAITLVPPYQDLIQKALYGQSRDRLAFLCEDEVSEAVVRGVLDTIGPSLNVVASDIVVGRDTGKDEFVTHLNALGKFGRLSDMAFVLDGDGSEVASRLRAAAERQGQSPAVLLLPGEEGPEAWIWRRLVENPERYAPELGCTAEVLRRKLADLDELYAGAADKPAEIAKNRLRSLAEDLLARTAPEVARIVARLDSADRVGDLPELADQIADAVHAWRARQA